jgi:ABC-type lipoprotein release transport system permease subunit
LRSPVFWIRIAFLFLLRSSRATGILSLMILSAVATLVFLSAMCVGINDTMIRNSVELYSGHITGFDLPPDFPREKLDADGVKAVLKRSLLPGALSSDGRLEMVTMIAVDPSAEVKNAAFMRKTVSGRFLDPGGTEVYLSRQVAEKLHVKPGDKTVFSGMTGNERASLTISGTYETGIDQLDRGIAFCPLGAVDTGENPWSAAVFLENGIDPSSVAALYGRKFPGIGSFKVWWELMPDLKQLIDLNYVSMGIVLVLVFGVVSLGIGCAFVIFILKTVREFGIMKAMGVMDWELAGLIAAEVILMNLAASLGGVVLGGLATVAAGSTGIDLTQFTSYNRYFAVSGVIFPRLTMFSLAAPPFLALLSGIAAAFWPAAMVIRKRTADILRII